jgi:predicted amidohydrolase
MATFSRYRIALAQIDKAPQSRVEVRAVLSRLSAEAAAGGADLMMLPELALCGYGDAERNKALAMTQEDAVAQVGEVAARQQIAILAGYAERADTGLYNAALLIGADGRCLLNYRKMHLWGPYEKAIFLPGDRSPVIDLAPGLKAGLLICFDLDHPVAVQDLVRRGADIVLVISATSRPYPIVPMAQVPTRAYDNAVFVAFCNQAGRQGNLDFVGMSTVAAPDGSVLARCHRDGAELAVADIDQAAFEVYRRNHRYAEQFRKDLFLHIDPGEG